MPPVVYRATKVAQILSSSGGLTLSLGALFGQVGSAYDGAIVATGGVSPYTLSYPSGYSSANLPPGISLDLSTGALSGTPATAGTYSFSVTCTDSTAPTPLTATQTFSIFISASGGGGGTSAPNALAFTVGPTEITQPWGNGVQFSFSATISFPSNYSAALRNTVSPQ
jgi:hypothetical protein